jgi:hypothetical protein
MTAGTMAPTTTTTTTGGGLASNSNHSLGGSGTPGVGRGKGSQNAAGGKNVVTVKPVPGSSRAYPRGVGLDFRKLGALTLLNYIDHHGKNVRVL